MLLGENLVDRVGTLVKKLWGTRRVAVVTQAVIERLHGDRLYESLDRACIPRTTLKMAAGESHKNLDTVNRLYDQLLREGFSRDDAVLAFGGGTVGDTAGLRRGHVLARGSVRANPNDASRSNRRLDRSEGRREPSPGQESHWRDVPS